MIQVMIFDLDGTLVQTERLKALSYARAAVELCPHALGEFLARDGRAWYRDCGVHKD